MSDIRLSMREFSLLEEKRKLAALSDAEERRWKELGQSLGIFEAGGSPARQNGAQTPVQAPPDEADGFAEVDPNDIMEVDPSDVLLVEPEAPEQIPGLDPSETVALTQNFEWVPESAPLPPGDTSPEQAPLLSPESSAAEADPGPTSIPLTQNFEWVPESAPAERSIPFEAEATGETAAEPIPLLSERSAETSAADTDPEPSSIPLTQNFEWVPASPTFESSVPLETEMPAEAAQLLPELQITSAEAAQLLPEPPIASAEAAQLLPEPPIASAEAGQLLPELQIASAGAVQLPPEPRIASAEAGQQVAIDAPVIDLLDSDAMQVELQSNSWESGQAEPGNAASALAIEDLPPLEEAQIEPVAQWANEPAPPAFQQQSPVPVEAPPPKPHEPHRPYAADSTSGTGYTQISSSEPPSFQFEINEELTPATPPDRVQPEEIAEAPTRKAHEAQVAPAAILRGGAAATPPAQADPETSFEDLVPIVSANFVAGEHRVVVHLIDGQVKRGTVQDLDLTAGTVPLQSGPGVVDNIATDRLKAIFFMLAPGAPKTAPGGQKIRLTLQDGREVVGFSDDFKTGTPGFFLRPADERTNTARIFVPRWSVYSIDEQ